MTNKFIILLIILSSQCFGEQTEIYDPHLNHKIIIHHENESISSVEFYQQDSDGIDQLYNKVTPEEQKNDDSSFWSDLWDCMVTIYNTVSDGVSYLQEQFSFESYAKKDTDYVLEEIFGQQFLAMTGYYVDHPHCGVYGNRELHDKVRITCINGILNIREDWMNSVKEISNAHGGINVHYVLYPTEGWTMDLVLALLAKCDYKLAYTYLLADMWKEMIQEMGGIEGGGTIVHYAHSIGGTNTILARDLLTPEEQKMIRVITLGTATMVPNVGFQSAINYVSYRDGVSMTDPVGFFTGLCQTDSNVIFLGTALGIPFIDHMLSQETYRSALEMFGQEFLNKYAEYPPSQS